MKTFAGKEIVTFLKAIDRHLEAPFRMEMILDASVRLAIVDLKDAHRKFHPRERDPEE
ncbi:MAG TPA: hypothetical protein VG457_19160 [Planctomycetota bacterium]|jgi:hypothetical protein|nr:hypothetical protein [Planctomycetota bacterium]